LENLSAVPEAEQCGWLKNKDGLSWQIVPSIVDKMMQDQILRDWLELSKPFSR
jgi:predicted 3-demethylubiquinone-9 3-methyltransferase (glyoxalase superfamily)